MVVAQSVKASCNFANDLLGLWMLLIQVCALTEPTSLLQKFSDTGLSQRHDLEEVESMPVDGNELVTMHPRQTPGAVSDVMRC